MMGQANLKLIEGKGVDKSKALDAALAQIERSFGKGSIMRLGASEQIVEIETVSTGSLGLDIALGVGGLPKGRIRRQRLCVVQTRWQRPISHRWLQMDHDR